jgi:D-glycero-D-manno-heptose 1,7-bisphosphate phosphatase
MRRAVFLDRDGVLNRNIWNEATQRFESPLTTEQFELLPKVISALQLLRDKGFLLFLVSNQPNFAKGKASMETLDAIHARLETVLEGAGISFAAFYYCFHHPEFTGRCICRKPSPHFLFMARKQFGVELERSWMVGDRATDVACGRAAGAQTIEICSSRTARAGADFNTADLWSAAQLILAHSGE